MPIEFEQSIPIGEGEHGECGCDFTRRLKTTETLTTPLTVLEIEKAPSSVLPLVYVASTDLTLSDKGINSAVIEIARKTIAINKAVTFTVSEQKKGYTYRIRVTVDTSLNNTIIRDIILPCI